LATDPVEILRVSNTLGEGILWDSRRHVLWWTDIQSRRLYRHDWASRATQILDTPERVGSFGLVAGSDHLVVAFESGVALYDPYARHVSWLARPEAEIRGIRFNDGRVDRQGRFWCGTMVEDRPSAVRGNLYCVDRSGRARREVRGVSISNSLCTSPDGTHLYFADSPTHTINVYRMIEPDGTLEPPRAFARTPQGSVPDGATVDEEGYVWSAQWGGSRVVRYAPDGRIDRTLEVPVTQPSCVCFGGPNLDLLFVTSARENLPAAVLEREPHAGDVLVYRTGVKGLPEPEYRT